MQRNTEHFTVCRLYLASVHIQIYPDKPNKFSMYVTICVNCLSYRNASSSSEHASSVIMVFQVRPMSSSDVFVKTINPTDSYASGYIACVSFFSIYTHEFVRRVDTIVPLSTSNAVIVTGTAALYTFCF